MMLAMALISARVLTACARGVRKHRSFDLYVDFSLRVRAIDCSGAFVLNASPAFVDQAAGVQRPGAQRRFVRRPREPGRTVSVLTGLVSLVGLLGLFTIRLATI